MRSPVYMRQFALAAIGLAFASAALDIAVAHETHKMECNATAINGMKADIQSMPEGEARTTATQEMQMAEGLMAKNDMEGCMAHMHKAMEALEE